MRLCRNYVVVRVEMVSLVFGVFGLSVKDGQFMEKNMKRNEVKCKLYYQVLKHASNTTNIWFHLQTDHQREYVAMDSQERARPASNGSSTSADSRQ